MSEIVLKAVDFHEMKDPTGQLQSKKYVCYIDAESLDAQLLDWMFTNPREQNMKSKVARAISSSLLENANFHELNRGLVFLAEDALYDNETGELKLRMENPLYHGSIDGGHTLRTIIQSKDDGTLPAGRYVFAEIFTGSDAVQLAEARNTSVQLDTKSIAELEGHFNSLKACVEKSSLGFASRVSYKMNQNRDEDFRSIDARELIAIISMFDHTQYPPDTQDLAAQPTSCYTNKEGELNSYVERVKAGDDMLVRLDPIIQDIFLLWDKIERELPALYGRKFKNLKTSRYKDGDVVTKALFSGADLEYNVHKGFIYPILASFSELVEMDSESKIHRWVVDPIQFWTDNGELLAQTALNAKCDGPVFVKSKLHWKDVHLYVVTLQLRRKLAEQ